MNIQKIAAPELQRSLSLPMVILYGLGVTVGAGIYVLIGEVAAGEQVLVSGAAGSTGMLACQVAKAAGARVVGIAGGAEKCVLLAEKLGMDGCIDYKSTSDLAGEISQQFPEGVDVSL